MSGYRKLCLSVSKAKTFDQCRKKFFYQYILKLPSVLKDYNVLGSLVHYVLDCVFKKWIDTQYEGDLRQILVEVWGSCRESKEWKEAEQFDVIDQVRFYLIEYYKKYIVDHIKLGKPIKCECSFNLPLKIGQDLEVEVVGYIDRIDRVDYKTLLLLDYKTTNKVQYLDNFQLGVYVAACLHGPFKGYNINAAYVLLKHGMKLKSMKDATNRYIEQVDKMVNLAIEMDRVINITHEYSPSFSKLCDYCDFKERCYKETGGPRKVHQIKVGSDTW